MTRETRLAHAGRDSEHHFGIVNPPVYRASTILYPTVAELEGRSARKYTGFPYGLYGTPTTLALADAVAEISGGFRTVITSSGLSALTQVLTALLRTGDHLLLPDSVYAPVRGFGSSVLGRYGVEVTYYDPLIGSGVRAHLRQNTRVVMVESPGSLTFEVQDVPAIAAEARAGGAVVVMDNTWATPIFFRAFDHGVDLEVQAGTKYLAGHSDLLVGTITARNEDLFRVVRDGTAAFGDCVAPDICYETLKGIRTLGLRMRHHERSALEVAAWLADRPEVRRVLHPGLSGDPGHALWKRDYLGSSSLFSVVLKTTSDVAVAAMLDGMQLFKMGMSFGGFESLIVPLRPAQYRSVRPWREPGTLLRLHVGLESVSDLIADLERGFRRLAERIAISTTKEVDHPQA